MIEMNVKGRPMAGIEDQETSNTPRKKHASTPSKRGRRPKAPEHVRKERDFRASDVEWRKIQADAASGGLKTAEYIRLRLAAGDGDGDAKPRGREFAELRDIAQLRSDVQMLAEDISQLGGALTISALHRLSEIEGKIDRLMRRVEE